MVKARLLHITEAWSTHSVRGFPYSLQRGGVVFGFRRGGGTDPEISQFNKLKIGILSSPSCGKFITAGNLPEDGRNWSYCLHDVMKNNLRYKSYDLKKGQFTSTKTTSPVSGILWFLELHISSDGLVSYKLTMTPILWTILSMASLLRGMSIETHITPRCRLINLFIYTQ